MCISNEETSLIRLTPGCGDEVVAELGEAHDEVDRRALQVGSDLEARVLPPGSILKKKLFCQFLGEQIGRFFRQ
jgi:hypothetical protein